MLNKKLTLDKAKIQFFYNTYNITGLEKQYVEEEKRNIEKYINMGDLQPAFVYSLEPLIIACFTDEFDDVILLQYPKEYIEKYNLKENDKLVTSNVYWEKRKTPYNDIVPGVFGSKRFKDIYPMVLKFLVTEEDKLEEDKLVYTDLVGVMMDSVTTIVNAISYILMAFVSISSPHMFKVGSSHQSLSKIYHIPYIHFNLFRDTA